jgi:glycerophosphoryl diester phosphodiesterase
VVSGGFVFQHRQMPTPATQRRRAICLVALLALCAQTVLVLLAAPADAARVDSYRVVAHRGYPGHKATENTLAAFRRAYHHGAPSIEVDIRMTADRVFILMHDRTLTRTTTCRGEVARRTATAIMGKCRGAVHRERIPTLTRALNWAAARNLNMLLEIKRDPLGRWSPEQFVRMNRLLERTGMLRRSHIFSLDDEFLNMAEAVNPDLETHSIVERWSQVAEVRTWADAVNVYARQLTRAKVAGLHADGLEVMGRNTNRRASWRRLDRVGVDGLLTDRLARYRKWYRRHH